SSQEKTRRLNSTPIEILNAQHLGRTESLAADSLVFVRFRSRQASKTGSPVKNSSQRNTRTFCARGRKFFARARKFLVQRKISGARDAAKILISSDVLQHRGILLARDARAQF